MFPDLKTQGVTIHCILWQGHQFLTFFDQLKEVTRHEFATHIKAIAWGTMRKANRNKHRQIHLMASSRVDITVYLRYWNFDQARPHIALKRGAIMIPCSLIAGLCCGILCTAKSSYIILAAAKYASLLSEEKDVVIARFKGISYFSFQLGGKYLYVNINCVWNQLF